MKAFLNKYSFQAGSGPKDDRPVRRQNKLDFDVYKINLDNEEKQKLVECFIRIKDEENLINKFSFRIEVLGAQVPDVVAERIFCIFASIVSSQSAKLQQMQMQEEISSINSSMPLEFTPDKMDFCDLVTCYYVFQYKRPQEISQLAFEMIKLTKDVKSLSRDDLIHWCVRILQLNENLVNLFYHRTKFDPRVPIMKEEFCKNYVKNVQVQQIPFFVAVSEVIDEFKDEYLNCKTTMYAKNLSLTEVHVLKLNEESQTVFGMDQSDAEKVREFFLNEIVGQNNDQVMMIYTKMFENIPNREIKTFMMFKITKFKANDYDFFQRLVCFTVSQTSFEQKLEFFFDLCGDFEDCISQENTITFCKMFRGKPPDTYPLSKDEFIEHFKLQKLDKIDSFLGAKHMMIGLMGIKSSGTKGSLQEQQKAIAAVLGQNEDEPLSLEGYIQENLIVEKDFYVINKDFWSAWSSPSGNPPDLIDNQKFIMSGHQTRWRENVFYNKDFVVVPRYVFLSLSKWYKCNKVIELKTSFRKVQEQGFRNESEVTIMDLNKNQIGGQRCENEQHGGQAGQSFMGTGHISMGSPFRENMKMTIGEEFHQCFEYETSKGIFDLQLYPKFFYFTLIDSKGNMPHSNAIEDGKIDLNYLTKYTKNNKFPFKELSISKHTKMEFIQEMITDILNQNNASKARMIINDHVITGLKLHQTADELKFESGTIIYVEYLRLNNTWPSESEKQTKKSSKMMSKSVDLHRETVGLYNLGNTCYMNSALQCLANIRHFHEYYVKNQTYSVQINKNSVLGHKGALVEAFASLSQQMWNSNQVVIPRGFRHAQAKIKEEFGNDDQQDTIEYINFLIDGLHEETNLRNDKPYIPESESDGKENIEFGLETWSNQIQRDWSFIYFMFYGQLQSTIECLTCKKKSMKFEIFNSVPLSLPDPSKVLLNIVVHRLPQVIRKIIYQQKNERSIDQTLTGEEINLIYDQNYADLTNDQPIHIAIKVPKTCRIEEMIRKIINIKEVNINPEAFLNQNFTELFLYSKQLGHVRGIFDQKLKLNHYRLITDEIHAQETLTTRGKEYLAHMWQHNSDWISESTQTFSYIIKDFQMWGRYYMDAEKTRKQLLKQAEGKKDDASVQFSQQYIFNNHYAACEKFDTLLQYQRIQPTILVVAYHRRFVQRENRIFNHKQPAMLSDPIILTMPLFPTGRRIYEEVWAMAQILLQKGSKFLNSQQQQKNILWWTDENWKEILKDEKVNGTIKPFVLKYVDRQGYNCSKCNWTQKCSGCVIEPTDDQRQQDFLKFCHIAIEWDSSMIEEQYNCSINEHLKHRSTERIHIDEEETIITLENCLEKFHTVEKLQDEVDCSECKIPRRHMKGYKTFRLPPILTIQLKRFKKTGNQYRKQGNIVEFPLHNLEMKPYLADYKFLESLDVSTKYNLFGIIYHYGSLTFGHYISVVKNPFSKKWFKYDDQRKMEIEESQVTKENAYILFYIRKDAENKEISDLFPDSHVIFPGKPVFTRIGKGFILGKKEDAKDAFYVKIKEKVYEINKDDILKNKADKFIEMCEEERDSLEQTMAIKTQSENKGFLSSFFGMFSSDSKKQQIKDIETEKGKLNTQQISPIVKKETELQDINSNKIQILKKDPSNVMNRKSRKKVENENEEEDDGPERAQIRAELEDNEQLLEEKSAGGSQSIVTKKKKKKKIRKITNEEAQLSSELTNLEAQLK